MPSLPPPPDRLTQELDLHVGSLTFLSYSSLVNHDLFRWKLCLAVMYGSSFSIRLG